MSINCVDCHRCLLLVDVAAVADVAADADADVAVAVVALRAIVAKSCGLRIAVGSLDWRSQLATCNVSRMRRCLGKSSMLLLLWLLLLLVLLLLMLLFCFLDTISGSLT